MSLPKSHLDRLYEDLRVHEVRLDHLRDEISRLSAEASAHETIISLGRDDQIIEVLGEMSEDIASAKTVTADPEKFFRGKNIQLPEGAQLNATSDGNRTVITVRLPLANLGEFTCIWDSVDGFSLGQRQNGLPGPETQSGKLSES